jgi:hypothetical protein
MRFFRCLDGDAAYEQARLALDAAWGLPNAETKTTTCIDPASVAPRDQRGRIVLAANDEFCEYPAAQQMLAYMIGGGAAEEITEADYRAAVEPPSPVN